MRRLTILAVAAFSWLQVLPASAAGIEVRLEAVQAEVLPGIPPTLRLVVTNDSGAEIHLRPFATLRVTRDDGTTFTPFCGLHCDGHTLTHELLPFEHPVVDVPAGSSREWLDLMTESLRWSYKDARLSYPGTYVYQYTLKIDGAEVTTNAVTVRVVEPSGIDAEVWQRALAVMKADSPTDAWTFHYWELHPALVEEIFSRYPDSAYLPYMAALKQTSTLYEKTEVLDLAIRRSPPGPFADVLRLHKAGLIEAETRGPLWSGRNLDGVLDHLARARDVYEDVAKHSSYSFMRERANMALRKLLTAEEEIEIFNSAKTDEPPGLQRLVPFVDCIEPTPTGFIARFGYTNPNTNNGKERQPGSGNRFVPGPADAGQPRWFMHGTHHEVVSVVSNGAPVRWDLDGNAASASRDFATSCQPPRNARPIRPVAECVQHENEGAVVTFGYDNPNAFVLQIPVGDRNTFGGITADRGQPTVFLSGRQRSVFRVKVTDGSVAWTLSGLVATAARGVQNECQP